MKKIIREVNKEKGVIQVTIADERWYWKSVQDKKQLKSIDTFVPSVTWICGYYPKGIHFYKWLAEKGWDEAEAIKSAAGDKGSKVHSAIVDLIDGKEVKMDSKYLNQSSEKDEELTLEEYEAIMNFVDFYSSLESVKTINREFTVFSDKYNYAGTVDWLVEINGELWLIDFKTSKSIWTEYELQVSSYGEEVKNSLKLKSTPKLGIVQIGYPYNKRGWKLTEIENKFDLFLVTQKLWEQENKDKQPPVKDYPEVLKLIKKVVENKPKEIKQ